MVEEGGAASHFSNELLNRPCQRPTGANYHLRPVVVHFVEKADSRLDEEDVITTG